MCVHHSASVSCIALGRFRLVSFHFNLLLFVSRFHPSIRKERRKEGEICAKRRQRRLCGFFFLLTALCDWMGVSRIVSSPSSRAPSSSWSSSPLWNNQQRRRRRRISACRIAATATTAAATTAIAAVCSPFPRRHGPNARHSGNSRARRRLCGCKPLASPSYQCLPQREGECVRASVCVCICVCMYVSV